jgi:cytochrome c553
MAVASDAKKSAHHVVATLRRAHLEGVAFSAVAVLAWAGCSSGNGRPGITLGGAPPNAISVPPSGGPLQPTFGKVVTASTPPPPVSGGTLLVLRDGNHAVAADPARDAVYVVDLGARSVLHTISLPAGDEPGRVVEDGAGHVHVALRRGGSVVTIDPLAGSVLARRAACPAPRGVAWDSATNLLWVACATGELVSMPAAGAGAITRTTVERDLRDVVVGGGALSISTFRTAEVLRVSPTGSVTRRDALPSPDTQFTPHVAWRTIAGPSGSVIAVHQASTTQALSTTVQGGYGGGGCGFIGPPPPGGGGLLPPGAIPPPGPSPGTSGTSGAGACYTRVDAISRGLTDAGPISSPDVALGGPCPPQTGAVMGVLTIVANDGTVTVNQKFAGVMPVDVAISPDGLHLAAVATGNAFTTSLPTIFEFDGCGTPQSAPQVSGQPTAVAFDPRGNLIVQTREPASLLVYAPNADSGAAITLSSDSRADTGFDIFHTQAGGMIACGSCHPEGGDDGHVWLLDGATRRTPSLRGTIAGTAPYHWPGDEQSMDALLTDVYTKRMSGASLDRPQMDAINGWVQNVPAPPSPSWVDSQAAARGKTLFESAAVGCATCHSGPKYTNNQTVDVGTGGKFQVPPLVGVGWRSPLFHDGCATSLGTRFGACSTPTHGSIGSLSAGDLSDLIAYLETL